MAENGFDHGPVRFASWRSREPRQRGRAAILARLCDEAPPCMRWRGLAFAPRPWPPDCSRAERLAATTSVRFWLSAPVARPFPRRPRFPWDLNPSSVVRNFYCLRPLLHKAFRPSLQDSFVVHRTSAVYPLCTVPFHWPIHRSVHNLCGQTGPRAPRVQCRAFSAANTGSPLRSAAEVARRGWEYQLPANRRTDDVVRRTAGGRGQRPQPGQDPNRDRSRGADQPAGSRRGGLCPAGIGTCSDRVCPELLVFVRRGR